MQRNERAIKNASLKVSVIATALWSGVIAVLLSDIVKAYSLVGTQVGLASSMFSTGALVALLASIGLQSKFQKSHMILVCGLLCSAMLLVQGIPLPFPLFLGACMLMGMGHGAADSCQSSLLADWNPDNATKQMGALHGIFGIGGVVTPLFLQSLLRFFPWRTVYVIVGVLCVALIGQFGFVTRRTDGGDSSARHADPKLTAQAMKSYLGNQRFRMLLLCLFFGAAAQNGILVWTIRYVSVFLNDPGMAALCLSIFWIASTISRFGSPMLPLRPALVIALGALASAAVWGIAIGISRPLGVCVAAAVVGLVSGSCIPMCLSIGAAIFPQATGFSTSVLMIFKTTAQILSPIVLAFVMSLGTMQVGMYITSLFFLLNGVFALLMLKQGKQSAPGKEETP